MSSTFTLITYNARLFEGIPLPWLTFEESRRKRKILQKIVELAPDIICLQEIWTEKTRRWFLDNLPSPFTGYAPDEGRLLGTSGLLLLSKHKICEARFTAFTHSLCPDSLAPKGFLQATIRKENGDVLTHIMTTHMQANKGKKYQKVRASQLRQISSALQEWQEQHKGKKEPFLFCGDLNVIGEDQEGSRITDENHQLIKTMAEVGMFDAFRIYNEEDGFSLETGYTLNIATNKLAAHFNPKATPQGQRIDYIFLNDEDTSFTINECKVDDTQWFYQSNRGTMDLSDHYPVFLELEQHEHNSTFSVQQ